MKKIFVTAIAIIAIAGGVGVFGVTLTHALWYAPDN